MTLVINKFYNKLWTLRFLKRSGIDSDNLLKVYKTVILPSVEYCSEIYDSLIPTYLSDRLESVQRQCMKIIFGWSVDYHGLILDGKIKSLQTRRTEVCTRFANRALQSATFGPKWFRRNPATRDVRQTTRREFVEKKNKTERARNNPIQHMTRLLNQQSSR